MLPATKSHRFSLADVLPSCASSLLGEANALRLPPVDAAVVLLVDGLGAAALKARAGHARTLASRLTPAAVIDGVFPTTTAAALATLTTGEAPGRHGLVGYSVLQPERDRVVNQLSGWDGELDPQTWQRCDTVFQRHAAADFGSYAVGPARFADSGFTRAVLRGAEYVPAASIAERLEAARSVVERAGRALVYVYVPELDSAGHALGTESAEWTEQLEEVDRAVREFSATLGARQGLLVTADHGALDVPHRAQVFIDSSPELVEGVRFVAGEPRCLQLHAEAGEAQSLLHRWRAAEGGRAWVLGRSEAIAQGWFGPAVDAEVEPRIGDVIVAARKRIAYYDGRTASAHARAMVGQHGSWSSEESRIPLLRLGAFEPRP